MKNTLFLAWIPINIQGSTVLDSLGYWETKHLGMKKFSCFPKGFLSIRILLEGKINLSLRSVLHSFYRNWVFLTCHSPRIREMKILSCEDLWLSDEIMERAYQKFLEVGKTKGLFSLDDPQQPKIVVISAHALQHAVLRFLVKDKE